MLPNSRSEDERLSWLRERASRVRTRRVPPLPDPSGDVVLRPHTPGALTVELMAGLLGLFVAVDGVRRSSPAAVVVGLVWAAVLIGVGLLAFRRSTRFDGRGVTIRHVFGGRTLAWDEVSGFDLLPHRRGRKERIAAVTGAGPVTLEHGDSKSLVLRPELSEQWYRAVIDRLESVRRRYV